MKAIPETRPPSTERYRKRTSPFGSTRSTTLTPEETIKLRVHHEKQMRQMLRSLTPQRESYPLFLQYKRGDPNVLDNFLKKEGILPHREEPEQRKQRRSRHSLPSPFEYIHQNKVFRTDKALVVAQDLLHVKKDYLEACKELRKIVQRSPGSVYSSNTPSSLTQEYDSATGPLTDRYFRGPGGNSPKRRKSKQELHSYSATSLAFSHNGKDLDAFIEKNNCFEGKGVDKAWRKVKADYLRFIERRDPVVYKEGPTGDLVLESGEELKYEPASIRNRQRQLAKLRKQDFTFKQEMKSLHEERCKVYYRMNERRNGNVEPETRYTLEFPKLQEELKQQEQMIMKEQNIELLGSDQEENEKQDSQKDFTFNAGIRPCPPSKQDASFKRRYSNFVQKVQRMTQPVKKSIEVLPKVAKTIAKTRLPQFRLNPDIKIAEKTIESCESTPRSKQRMSVFISSGFSAPRVYLTPRSKSSLREYATPTGKKDSSNSSNPAGDRPPIPISILMTMIELRKDRFASFQIMFPFNEPTCRILMELLTLRPNEKRDHRNQQIKLLNLLLEELKKHTFNYFNKALSQTLLRPQ